MIVATTLLPRLVRARALVLIITMMLLVPIKLAFATQPWTPQHIAEEYQQSHAVSQPWIEATGHHGRPSTLDEIAYFEHFNMLCQFLVSLQDTVAGTNLGGEIEAEAEQNIIQTDNTQEAIREWSQWAIWTGDTATYGPNIRLAMDYLMRYPAWREDLEGGFYYGAHNCGWGFEAAAKYRQAYGDTSWNWYADSCALWTVAHNITIDTVSTALGQLDPLAEGLAIGGLYPHAVYRQRADWHNYAVNKGRTLRRWFERNPARLNNNETWALCGGTALWGVCESFFAEYPDSGAAWVNQYGSQLRVWTSSGQWNHSACCWYGNAQNKCFELTGDSTYWNNAVYICDSLIGLDLDHDGGIIPGRTYPQTDDASWVSSYMGWMGMERIINTMPIYDVAARGFVSPDPMHPHMGGDSLVIRVRVANTGVMAQQFRVHVTGLTYDDSLSCTLSPGTDSIVTLAQRWYLPDNDNLPSHPTLFLRVSGTTDENPANDTLTGAIEMRHGVSVMGSITGPQPSPQTHIRVDFFHEAYPDSAWASVDVVNDSIYTNGARRLMAGFNTIRISPPLSFLDASQTVELVPGDPQRVDFDLSHSDLALIDDSPGDSLETYYLSALDTFNLRIRMRSGATEPMTDVDNVPVIVWFTGNATGATLNTFERTALQSYVANGGHLILTGQNISDDSSCATFLHDVLFCTPLSNNTGQQHAQAVDNDSIFGGTDIWLQGAGGAQNQNSPSSVGYLDGGTPVLQYTGGDQEVCGVTSMYGTGRSVFFSFGMEGISGINGTTTRRNLLARCFHYFGFSPSATGERPELPATVSLDQNFPNPFNPSTTIGFLAPRGARPVQLVIYNLLGQEVCTLYNGIGTGETQRIMWNGLSASGLPVSSGMYIYRLRAGTTTLVRPLQLVR
jgi:hypothetical protein